MLLRPAPRPAVQVQASLLCRALLRCLGMDAGAVAAARAPSAEAPRTAGQGLRLVRRLCALPTWLLNSIVTLGWLLLL